MTPHSSLHHRMRAQSLAIWPRQHESSVKASRASDSRPIMGPTKQRQFWSGEAHTAVQPVGIFSVPANRALTSQQMAVAIGSVWSPIIYLGSFIRGDLREGPTIGHRHGQMQAIFQPLRKKLLYNPCLTIAEKRRLLMERVFPRYLHGAGLWRLQTGKEQDGAIMPLAQAIRSAVRPILGFTSEGLDQTEACAALDIPIPQELLRGEQLRAWTELAREADAFTWLALCEDGVWMQQAYDASEPILRGTGLTLPRPQDAGACRTFAIQHKQALRNAIRAYLRRQVDARAAQGRQVRGSRDLWQRPPAVTTISLVDDLRDLQRVFHRRTAVGCASGKTA